MLASVLGAAGVRAGLYTKPHLQTYRERIRVDGRAISEAAFDAALVRMRQLTASLPRAAGAPTTFEVTTALALDVFEREHCDVAVVEVGLGGRLDATNATDPLLSVITPISYDHTAILGHTLGAIAAEKAGIMRSGRVALLAEQRPAALAALHRTCRSVGARCRVVPPVSQDVPLAGLHQRQNAALALAAARELAPNLADATIRAGLARLKWPGRFEVVGDIVLDGAHNGASAEALATTLTAYAAGRPVSFVIGINRDKDARAVVRPLAAIAARFVVTQTTDNPRALDAAELARLCRRLEIPTVVELDVQRAIESARCSTTGLTCVTGSLKLVGLARAALGLPIPERLW
jgi:dihydrofolate synthase/folylpolyglutamate synthase